MAAGGGPEEVAGLGRRVLTGAGVLVLVALAGVTVREAARVAPGGGGDLEVRAGADRDDAGEPALPPPADGSWEPLPPSGLEARSDAVAVWTGREVFVWGGTARRGGIRRTFHDGARYDPATRTWSALAAGPPQRWQDGVVGVWTGGEVLLLGGRNRIGSRPVAQAYDPDRDAWRPLPAPPPGEWAWRTAVWTGQRVVVLHTTQPDGYGEGALHYDPVADAWRRAPAVSTMHLREPTAAAVWLDGEVVVSGQQVGSPRLVVQAFDPSGSAWRRGRGAPVEREWLAAMAADEANGDVLLAGPVPGGDPGFHAARWNRRDGWRPLPDVPQGLRNARPVRVFATPAGPLLWPNGDVRPSLFDGGSWRPLPPPPTGKRVGEAVVWTADGLFVWGGHGPDEQPSGDGALLRPGAGTGADVPPPAPDVWTGSWTAMPPLPGPVAEARLFADPGGISAVTRGDDGEWRVHRLLRQSWDFVASLGREADGCVTQTGMAVSFWARDFEAKAWRARSVDVRDGHVRDLPPPPLPVHGMAGCASWRLGTAVVSQSGEHAAAAWYDHARGLWEALPQPPHTSLLIDVVADPGTDGAPLLILGDRGLARLAPGGQWALSETPRSHFAASAPSVVWAGDRLLVWGGTMERPLRDGWEWHPDRDRWRQIPAAWFGGTSAAAPHTWTGTHWVVWGEREPARPGSAGLPEAGAYDPASRRWSSLPEPPSGAPVRAAVWDADVIVVLADGTVWRLGGSPGPRR